jgi:hypothetical protein
VQCQLSNVTGVTRLATSEYGVQPGRNQHEEEQEAVHNLIDEGLGVPAGSSYTMPMRFVWDEDKRLTHIQKHGIDFRI